MERIKLTITLSDKLKELKSMEMFIINEERKAEVSFYSNKQREQVRINIQDDTKLRECISRYREELKNEINFIYIKIGELLK